MKNPLRGIGPCRSRWVSILKSRIWSRSFIADSHHAYVPFYTVKSSYLRLIRDHLTKVVLAPNTFWILVTQLSTPIDVLFLDHKGVKNLFPTNLKSAIIGAFYVNVHVGIAQHTPTRAIEGPKPKVTIQQYICLSARHRSTLKHSLNIHRPRKLREPQELSTYRFHRTSLVLMPNHYRAPSLDPRAIKTHLWCQLHSPSMHLTRDKFLG
jgi:hypothetical protein